MHKQREGTERLSNLSIFTYQVNNQLIHLFQAVHFTVLFFPWQPCLQGSENIWTEINFWQLLHIYTCRFKIVIFLHYFYSLLIHYHDKTEWRKATYWKSFYFGLWVWLIESIIAVDTWQPRVIMETKPKSWEVTCSIVTGHREVELDRKEVEPPKLS